MEIISPTPRCRLMSPAEVPKVAPGSVQPMRIGLLAPGDNFTSPWGKDLGSKEYDMAFKGKTETPIKMDVIVDLEFVDHNVVIIAITTPRLMVCTSQRGDFGGWFTVALTTLYDIYCTLWGKQRTSDSILCVLSCLNVIMLWVSPVLSRPWSNMFMSLRHMTQLLRWT